MVYDWDDKRETCYRMYVVERKTLDDIMNYFKQELGFVPSKRAFQTQFKRWEFPSKQNPAHRNEELVARTRELWEKNTMQKDMVTILNAEGFEVSERELMRVRSKHRLLLRSANGGGKPGTDDSRLSTANVQGLDEEDMELLAATAPQPPTQAQPQPENQLKRKERQDLLQQASDEKWSARKRRRRLKGYAGLAADPPGPPRFPSETTLGESQAYLGLGTGLYQQVREQFEAICHEQAIVKKTIAGPEKWQTAKTQLIEGHPHLLQLFQNADQEQLTPLHLCLDVLCLDVTKRLRIVERAMTLAEAKNLLGINPAEARQLRQQLIDILTANHFVNKHESENWEGLKAQWLDQGRLLQRVPADEGPEREKALKALQMLTRDIMKRWNDSQTQRDPNKTKKGKQAGGDADDPTDGAEDEQHTAAPLSRQRKRAQTQAVQATAAHDLASHGPHSSTAAPVQTTDLQIDPSLLLAASASSVAAMPHASPSHQLYATNNAQSYDASAYDDSAPQLYDSGPEPTNAQQSHAQAFAQPVPAYFRLHAQSTVSGAPPLWLAALAAPSMSALRAAALSFSTALTNPDSTMTAAKIEGLVAGVGGAAEMLFQIDADDELVAYLEHVGRGKASFVVEVHGTAGDGEWAGRG